MSSRQALLRSVNLGLDLGVPNRFAHFCPTPKSSQVIRAVAFGSPSTATMVVAAYGSGKSLAAGFACMAMAPSNTNKAVTGKVLSRLAEFDASLADRLERLRGLPVVLEGAQDNLGDALLEAASAALNSTILRPGRQGIMAVLDAIASAAKAKGLGRVAIVWDEFGRHLESLAAEGRAYELAQLQQAAEWASRQVDPKATLTLLMHQGIFYYTAGLSQAARSAWRKVEGRFDSIRYVDDSKEMHRLVASVVKETRPAVSTQTDTAFMTAAMCSLEAGLFPAFVGDAQSLADILAEAWPLDPAALHVLPGLAARVAQHERSVFAFVDTVDLSRRVTLKDVYDHFSPAMEADVGIGGSHRRWIEAESCLSKTNGADEALVVASAALLGLGSSGQRVKISKRTLLTAIAPYGEDQRTASAVETLLTRKLLLHRHRTDDISVWHGTDIDLRGRLEDERCRMEGNFELVRFLSAKRPAPIVRPTRHNLSRWVNRVWTGSYVAASDLCSAGAGHPLLKLDPGEDGRVLYVIAEGAMEVEAALTNVPKLLSDGGVIACICKEPLPLSELAIEVACLERLSKDEGLLGSDPLAGIEIAHMADAAMEALDRLLDRAVTPGKRSQAWVAGSDPLPVQDSLTLSDLLSKIANERFPNTPAIRNELVVRRKLSRPMVNARKRLLLSILERSGEPHLGFDFTGGTPDVAMYRTVLHRTGLYRENKDGIWGWAFPNELKDQGLKAVWLEVQHFFQKSARSELAKLIDTLLNPPFGVRPGLLPLLTAAGLKAFGRAVAIRRNGILVPDILASAIEEMCSRPELFEVEVFNTDNGLGDYLRGIAEEFGNPAPEEGDLLRHALDAMQAWKKQLPASALTSKQSDKMVHLFQNAVGWGNDPVDVILERFPQLAKETGVETIEAVRRCRMALEAVVEGYQANAVRTVRETLMVSKLNSGDALSAAKEWASCFSGAVKTAEDKATKALLLRASSATDGRYTEVSFARALSILLIGQDFDRWNERTPEEFARRLKATAKKVEEAALNAEVPDQAVRPVLEARASELLAKLVKIAGVDAAKCIFENVIRGKWEG